MTVFQEGRIDRDSLPVRGAGQRRAVGSGPRKIRKRCWLADCRKFLSVLHFFGLLPILATAPRKRFKAGSANGLPNYRTEVSRDLSLVPHHTGKIVQPLCCQRGWARTTSEKVLLLRTNRRGPVRARAIFFTQYRRQSKSVECCAEWTLNVRLTCRLGSWSGSHFGPGSGGVNCDSLIQSSNYDC